MNSKHRIKVLPLLFLISLLATPLSTCLGQITPPEDYLGYKPGADFHLATYEQLQGYFDLLASQTGRIKMFDMGPTTEGRRMRYAVISSDETMANIDHYREINRKLSFVSGLSEEESQRLAKEGKVVVWIESGMHSSETSPPMHQFQLVYDLVTGTDDRIQFIRDNSILLFVLANPDGMTLIADWYMKNVGTKYETSSMPVLYHKYAGHDNNRDFHVANLLETQNMNRIMGSVWCPELAYSQHETAPFPTRIWLPPNADPVNPNTHPVIFRWKNLIGVAMGQAFDAAGLPGAISRNAYDLWYPGYAGGPNLESHNIPFVLTETANYRYATPHYYTIRDFPENYRDLTAGTFYPSPWEGGWWRFSDAVKYNLTASKAVLDVASRYRYDFLYLKYKCGRDIIERFQNEPPYGWIFSINQENTNTMVMLFNRLIDYGIQIYKAEEAFVHEGISYPKESHIIPTSQPFGLYVKMLFEKQEYPDMRKYGHLWQGIGRSQNWKGQPIVPYDGVGWTLHKQMGIRAHEMSTPLKIQMSKIEKAVPPNIRIEGRGSHYVFSNRDNHSFTAVNRILKADGKVSCALSDFTLGGRKYPKGTFVVYSNSISGNTLRNIASDTHVSMQGGKASVKTKPVRKSRIALYKSWAANMDAGWISYILDKYEFTYHVLRDAEVKAGDLHDRFDVIILPDQRASSIINGHRKGTMPPNFIGGITSDGVENLRTFVEEGGVLVCNKSSVNLAIDQFNLPVKNVTKDVKPDSFNCPGSLLKVNYDMSHPITLGMEEKSLAYFGRGHAYEMITDTTKTEESTEKKSAQEEAPPPKIVAIYPDDTLLISGWLIGENVIREKAAILDVPYKKGKIFLFGFNVHNRAQTYLTFKLLFNAIYY